MGPEFRLHLLHNDNHLLQGRVEVPTGGKVREPTKGRTAAITVPTVKVWMKEDIQ